MVSAKYVHVWAWQCSYCGKLFRVGVGWQEKKNIGKIGADHCCGQYASEVDE